MAIQKITLKQAISKAVEQGAFCARAYRISRTDRHSGLTHKGEIYSYHFFNLDDAEISHFIVGLGYSEFEKPRYWGPEIKSHPDYEYITKGKFKHLI